jgi:hypothetical protein
MLQNLISGPDANTSDENIQFGYIVPRQSDSPLDLLI